MLIRGLGPIPAFGTAGRGDGHGDRVGPRRRSTRCGSCGTAAGSSRSRDITGCGPDWEIIRVAVQVRSADGHSGHRDEHRRRADAVVHRLARAERGGAGGVRRLVRAALLADHLDVGRADGRRGGDRRTEPRRRPSRTAPTKAVHVAARYRVSPARRSSGCSSCSFRVSCSRSSACTSRWSSRSATQLLRVLSVSGLFIAVALTYTGGLAGHGRHEESALHLDRLADHRAARHLLRDPADLSTLDPIDIWLAILVGHVTRCALSVLRFNQGKWRNIAIDVHPHNGRH